MILETGRDVTVTVPHKLHGKEKENNKHIYYTSLRISTIANPLVLLAANLSAPKSLKDFISWQNSNIAVFTLHPPTVVFQA